jgi:hypothetical protein
MMADKEADEANAVAAITSDEVPQNVETLSADTNSSHIETAPPPVKEKKSNIHVLVLFGIILSSHIIQICFYLFAVEVLLKATGDAPIMMKKKWVVSPNNTIGWISEFIKKCIKLGAEERLVSFII